MSGRTSDDNSRATGWILALGFALISLAMPLSAHANPEVRLEWIENDGESIDPPSNTVVVTEDDIDDAVELVLRISLVLDSVEIHEFGFTVIFDDDERDELDFKVGAEPEPPLSYDGPFDGIGIDLFRNFESDDQPDGFGEFGAYRGCAVGSLCEAQNTEGPNPVGNTTIVIDEVTFIPTATASNDRRDIVIREVPTNEEFRDGDGDVIPHSEIDFGFASVVPEPGSSLLTTASLLTIAALARRRRSSVA